MRRVTPSVTARAARAARDASAAAEGWAGLQRALLLAIFALAPVESRAVAGCVCHSWRDAASDRSLWKRLDLVSYNDASVRRALGSAAARAGGELEILKLRYFGVVPNPTLSDVLRANRGALREVHVGNFSSAVLGTRTDEQDLLWLLRELPSLCGLHIAASCKYSDHGAMLLDEPPYGPLRLHGLRIYSDDSLGDPADLITLLAAYPHECLKALSLSGVSLSLPAVAEAMFDAALAFRMTSLDINDCQLCPAAVPALARLVSGNALKSLHIQTRGPREGDTPLFDAPSSVVLAAALHANTSLTFLSLGCVNLGDDIAPFNAILTSLVGHPSLAVLYLYYMWGAHVASIGPALGALLAADAPALRELSVTGMLLGDDGAEPVVHGLAQNTHLRLLNVASSWGLGASFSLQQLLPVARAHPTLRLLGVDGNDE